MEQNGGPSSPLPHHNSSRRPSDAQPPTRDDSKLSLPSGPDTASIPRPSNPDATPPTATTSISGWSGKEGQTMTTPISGWSGKENQSMIASIRGSSGREAGTTANSVKTWSARGDSSVSCKQDGGRSTRHRSVKPSVSVGSWRDDEPSTQPLASTIRCPSPMPSELELRPQPVLTASSETSAYPSSSASLPSAFLPFAPLTSVSFDASSSLLTSEPLNRSASHPTSTIPVAFLNPTMSARQTVRFSTSFQRKRRNRSASLPNSDPVFKRRKIQHHDPPTPSEPWERTLAPFRRDTTKAEHQRARADVLGRRLLDGRQRRIPSVPRGDQIIVACRIPPINLSTLKSLDAHEILKNPQLRHDLLWEPLAFRPIHLSPSTSSAPHHDVALQASASTVDYRGTCAIADMYWEGIERELLTGCRCTRWRLAADDLAAGSSATLKRTREESCVCGKWRMELSEAEWWKWQAKPWPSRLPDMIRTLREILVSLMGSTTPCPNHFSHSFSREALEAHEASCPTVTHALVPKLYAALDPEFLTIQVRRGVTSFGVFEMLGEAMKVHCAPVRDAMVDDMVRTAARARDHRGEVAQALRKCFDCVEVMKLDIAHHQVHALRPYLWNCAPAYELAAFNNFLASSHLTQQTSKTQEWIHAASRGVLSATDPRERAHMMGRCLCQDNSGLMFRSLAEGFMELVFANWTGEGKWPPAVPRKGGSFGQEPTIGNVLLPEAFRLDAKRIRHFNAEVVELAIQFTILLGCRDVMLCAEGGKTMVTDLRLRLISKDLALRFASSGEPIPSPGVSPDHSDLSVQLASQMLGFSSTDSMPRSRNDHDKLEALAGMLDGYIRINATRHAPLFTENLQRVRSILTAMLSHDLLAVRLDPSSSFFNADASLACSERRGSESRRDGLEQGEHQQEEEDCDMSDVTEAPAPRQTVRSVPAKIRERQAVMSSRYKEAEAAEMRRTGLDLLSEELRGLVSRMGRIAGFNLGVFAQVYGGKGMMVGS